MTEHPAVSEPKPLSPLKAKIILRARARLELEAQGLSGPLLRKAAKLSANRTYRREALTGRRLVERP